MPREVFLVPMVDGGPILGQIPKYANDPAVSTWGAIRYSVDDDAIAMLDADQTYLNSVAAQTDATRLATETNLDSTVTAGQAAAAKTIFENAFIPDLFINAGDTRREVLRAVVGMFLFAQRLEARFGSGLKAKAVQHGVTLDSTWIELPQALKDELLEIRDSHGWTDLNGTGSTTLREILVSISEKFEETPITIGGFQI